MKTKKIKLGKVEIRLFRTDGVFMPSKRSLFLARWLAKMNIEGKRVIDVGSGSGFLSILCARFGASEILAIDINPLAIFQTKKNWRLNNLPSKVLKTKISDVFSQIVPPPLHNHFDLIISNPPGLPLDILNHQETKTFASWMCNSAGNDGRSVVDKILNEGPALLRAGGSILISHSSRLGFEKSEKTMNKNFSSWIIVSQKKFKLENHFLPFIDFWLKEKGRVFSENKRFTEIIRIIKATK